MTDHVSRGLAGFTYCLNQCLALDTEVMEDLAILSGKRLLISVTDLNLNCMISFKGSALDITLMTHETPDLKISGSTIALWQMLLHARQGQILTQNAVDIRGDLNLCNRLMCIIYKFTFDWEGKFTYYLPNSILFLFAKSAHGFSRRGKQFHKSMQANLIEFLQEEVRLLPGRDEVEGFLDSVDDLRLRSDRLEKRGLYLGNMVETVLCKPEKQS